MNYCLIECCAGSVEDAINGEKGGANRIELCDKLEIGGVTPLRKDILYAKEAIQIPLYILIRPRSGNFFYSKNEFLKILSDIKFCKKIGCEGVVVGCLNQKNRVDIEKMKRIVYEAQPMHVTFHRAFDEMRNLLLDLEDVIECKCDSLLTAGQNKNVTDGYINLQSLLKNSKNRINIIAGSGVNHTNIKKLYKIGVKNFHLSGRNKDGENVLKTKSQNIRSVVEILKKIE